MSSYRPARAQHPLAALRRTFLGLVAVLLLAACGGSPATSAPSGSGASGATPLSAASGSPAAEQLADVQELKVGISRNLVNGEHDFLYAHTNLQVWEPLIRYDNNLVPQPGLAEKWTLGDDGKSWTFQLKLGVNFSDGTPFNADAAIANIKRFRTVSGWPSIFLGGINYSEIYGDPEGIEKIDDTSFRLVYKEPRPLLPYSIANHYSAMFSPKSFGESGDFTGLPIGTGPYKLVDWKRDQYAELIRNEGYWGKKPTLTKISLKIYSDGNSRLSALKAGEVDALVELGAVLPAQARDLRNDPNFVVSAHASACSTNLGFNGAGGLFKDVRLRQAVGLAIDRNAFVRDLLYGYHTPAKGIMIAPNTTFFSTDPAAALGYDPTKAQALAKEALGGGRAKVTLAFSPPGEGITALPYPQIAAYLQATLKPLGLDIELKQQEAAALTDTLKQGSFDLTLANNCWATGDPNYILGRLLSSKATLNTTNNGGYNNPKVDELLAQARVTIDPAAQKQRYFEIEKIAAQEFPIDPLFDQQTIIAARPWVKGLSQRIAYAPTFETIYLIKH
jgi:peptide/nickel transport system substrate-binding protein